MTADQESELTGLVLAGPKWRETSWGNKYEYCALARAQLAKEGGDSIHDLANWAQETLGLTAAESHGVMDGWDEAKDSYVLFERYGTSPGYREARELGNKLHALTHEAA